LASPRPCAARWRWQGKTLDEIDIRLFRLIEELPRVSGETFDVGPLPFGIERIEDKRRFSRADQAGDDHHLLKRDLQAEVLQIVLACTTNFDNFRSAFSRRMLNLLAKNGGSFSPANRVIEGTTKSFAAVRLRVG